MSISQTSQTLQDKLLAIQSELKAPKNQFNKFGGYTYRSCEDILEAVKPLLVKHGATVTLMDDIVVIGDRYYVKAIATITDGQNSISVTAYAREEEIKKGMDGSQITGAASSYARKYALNGLFLIDDTKDSDNTNRHNGNNSQPVSEEEKTKEAELFANLRKLEAKIKANQPVDWEKAKEYFKGTIHEGRINYLMQHNILNS